jgi:hypothetical protein
MFQQIRKAMTFLTSVDIAIVLRYTLRPSSTLSNALTCSIRTTRLVIHVYSKTFGLALNLTFSSVVLLSRRSFSSQPNSNKKKHKQIRNKENYDFINRDTSRPSSLSFSYSALLYTFIAALVMQGT